MTRLDGFVARLRRRLFGQDAPLIELYLCLQAIAFGLVILFVTDMHLSSPLARQMDKVLPEDIWGAMLLAVGLFGLFAWGREDRRIRTTLAAIGTFGWTVMAVLVLRDGTPGIGSVTAPLAAIFSGLVYVRLAGVVRVRRD